MCVMHYLQSHLRLKEEITKNEIYEEKKPRKLSGLNSMILALLGVISFLVGGYVGWMISMVVPDLLSETIKSSFSVVEIKLWLLLGFYSLVVWFFGCIAARCHSLLYERWFE